MEFAIREDTGDLLITVKKDDYHQDREYLYLILDKLEIEFYYKYGISFDSDKHKREMDKEDDEDKIIIFGPQMKNLYFKVLNDIEELAKKRGDIEISREAVKWKSKIFH